MYRSIQLSRTLMARSMNSKSETIVGNMFRQQHGLHLPARGYSTVPPTPTPSAAAAATATPTAANETATAPVVDANLSHHATEQVSTNYEYATTFGIQHEVYEGGHVPGQWPHIEAIQDFLNGIRDTIGLPWWACIALTTLTFRLAVLPLNIALIRNSARLAVIRNELDSNAKLIQETEQEYVDRVHGNKETTQVNQEEVAKDLENSRLDAAARIDALFKKHKCNPLFNIASPILMAPLFLSVWMSVERICLHDPNALVEGLLWFPNLAVPDPTFLLPMLSGLTWLVTIEMGCDTPRTENMKLLRSGLRFLAAVMVPVTSAIPSGVFVYWITSNLFSMAQIIILQRFSAVRRMLRIPPRTMTAIQQKTKPISL